MPSAAELQDLLLSYCRQRIGEAEIEYDEPLTALSGGHEAFTGRFSLRGLTGAGPLILRWLPPGTGAGVAIESLVHNCLAAQGLPVPKVHYWEEAASTWGGDFMIMDFHLGQTMVAALDACLARLGETHAELHAVDSEPLRRGLRNQGLDESAFTFKHRLRQLGLRARALPWLMPGLDWLKNHQPRLTAASVVCHGDLHPFNILINDNRVSAVLDWSGFVLADPALDVAATMAVCMTAGRCLAPGLNWSQSIRLYLDGYRRRRPLDETNLIYFQALKCFNSLLEAAEGQPIWHRPGALDLLLAEFQRLSGLRLDWPGEFFLKSE